MNDLSIINLIDDSVNDGRPKNTTPNRSIDDENSAGPSENVCRSRSVTPNRNIENKDSAGSSESANSPSRNIEVNDDDDLSICIDYQMKEEPMIFLNSSSIINLSDDFVVENDEADNDDFGTLCSELAYNSDDDVDEQIQREFDHLVAIGKILPTPIIIKVEEENGAITNEGTALVQTIVSEPECVKKMAEASEVKTVNKLDENLDGEEALAVVQSTNLLNKSSGTSADNMDKNMNDSNGNIDPVGGHFEMIRQVNNSFCLLIIYIYF